MSRSQLNLAPVPLQLIVKCVSTRHDASSRFSHFPSLQASCAGAKDFRLFILWPSIFDLCVASWICYIPSHELRCLRQVLITHNLRIGARLQDATTGCGKFKVLGWGLGKAQPVHCLAGVLDIPPPILSRAWLGLFIWCSSMCSLPECSCQV